MNTQEFNARWNEKREQIKKEHPELTEDDLSYELGKEVELLKRLQKKLNKTEDEIKNWLSIMG